MIKVARKVEFLVSINYKEINGLTAQVYTFWTNNKKNLRYAYDSRYLLKRKIDKLIEDNLLNNFKSREENENNIIIYYDLDFKKLKNKSSKTFNLEFYLPPFCGCKYCTKAEFKDGFTYCKEKKKHYNLDGIKNCKVFKSIDEVLT